jgi:hypothetical protein
MLSSVDAIDDIDARAMEDDNGMPPGVDEEELMLLWLLSFYQIIYTALIFSFLSMDVSLQRGPTNN